MKKLTPILFALILLLALTGCESGPAYYTVSFDTGSTSTVPAQVVKSDNTIVEPKDPVKEDAVFKEWTLDGAKFDFATPITKNITLKATYTDEYTITFDSNGGSKVSSQTVKAGEKVLEPKSPTIENTTFKQWVKVNSDGTEATEAYDFSQPVTESFTLKAVYNKYYTVVFNTLGGSEIPSQTVVEGELATRPADPVKDGTNGFAKWMRVYGENYDVEYYDFTTPVTSDLKLVAIYKDDTSCTVTFDSQGGSSVSSQALNSGDKVVEPKSPTKENAVFKKWVKVGTDGTEATEAYDFTEPVTESFTLKAVYATTYKVTFDSDEGSYTPSVQTVEFGECAVEPKSPEKEKSVFEKWVKVNADGTTTAYDFSQAVTGDITLKATYCKEYTVKFLDAAGNTYLTQTVKENTKATKVEGPKKDGAWSFDCWLDERTGAAFNFETLISCDVVLMPNYINGYTVTFDTNGGYGISSQIIKDGEKVQEPKSPTKENATFKFWVKVNSDGTASSSAYNFEEAVTESFILKAVYNTTYKVTFDSDSGSYTPSVQYVEDGKCATEPKSPTKESSIFDKWVKVNADGTTAVYDFSTVVTGDITLKATYCKEYIVTFLDASGNTYYTQYVKENTKATKIEGPKKDGAWSFDCWYDKSTGEKFDFDTLISGETTLDPHYIDGYTVKFDTNGGSDISTLVIKSGEKVTEPKNPTKENANFKYWVKVSSDAAEASTAYDFNSAVTESFTLKAVYSTTHKVSFNNGSSITTQYVEDGENAVEPKSPTKEGATFKYWVKDAATTAYDFSTPVTEDITLKAVYDSIYTVTFDSDGGSSVLSQSIKSGELAVEPKSPTKENASFKEWVKVNADGTTTAYDFSTPVTGAITLKAVYDAVYTYTVKFNTNGGGTIPYQTVKAGGTVIEPKNPTKDKTYFKQWVKVGSDGTESTEAYDFSSPVTESFTLKAVYYTTYTVTFWSKGGKSPANDIQYVKEGDFVTEPAMPVNTSKWGFKEWALVNEDGTTSSFDFLHTQVKSNLTFWALYYEKYTVTYKDSDGTLYATKTVKEGTEASNIEGPEKEGAWSFKYWALEGTTEAYNFTTKVTSDITLVPIYVNGYTVTFDSNGGTEVASQFVEEGKTIVEPKAPEKESTRGFMWWTTEVDQYGNSVPYDLSTPVTGDLKLIAVYWPANLRLEDYTGYDNEMAEKYNEVRYQHYIITNLVQIDSLMNKSTDVASVFGITDKANNDLVLSLFTYAKMNPDKVTFKDGTTIDLSDSRLTYEINVDKCSIESNTTEKVTNSIDNTKYTVNITNLVFNITFRYPDMDDETQEVKISLKGAFLKNSDDRYELHMKTTVDGKEYPVLHGFAILSPKEKGSSEYDNVLCFSYDGFTSYIPGIQMW